MATTFDHKGTTITFSDRGDFTATDCNGKHVRAASLDAMKKRLDITLLATFEPFNALVLVEKITAAARVLADAVEEYNNVLETAKEPVEKALEAYNEVLGEVREFASDIASQADSDISDKSEKWQEGEKGQAATSFKDEWENFSPDDLEVELPEPLELPVDPEDVEQANELEGLPESADEL